MLTLRLSYIDKKDSQIWVYELSGPLFTTALFNVTEADCREMRCSAEDVAYNMAKDLLEELDLNHLHIEVQ